MHHQNTATDSLGGLHVMNSLNRATRRSLRACPPCFVSPLCLYDEGSIRTMECRVDGYPKPEIRWERGGRPVGKGRRVHMTRSGDRCLLQIKMPCSSEECGTYSCVATNSVGTAHSRVAWPTGTDTLKMNAFSYTSLPSPKLNRARSQSRERSSESALNVSSIRSGNVSRKPTPASKTKLTTFTSHIWAKNAESEDPQKATLGQKKESVLEANKKQLSKSMDDCRKNRRGFLNRVKIPDIFTASKSCKQVDTPIKSKPHKVSDSSRNSKPCKTIESRIESKSCNPTTDFENVLPPQRTEKRSNGTEVRGKLRNYQSSIKSDTKCKEDGSCPKSNSMDNATEQNENDDPIFQLSTRERIAAYLKRFEISTGSVMARESLKEQKSVFKRSAGSEKKPERKASRDETFFGKFRRRVSNGDAIKKNSADNGRLEEESSSDQPTSAGCTLECARQTPNLEGKKSEDDIFSKFRKRIKSPDDSQQTCDENTEVEDISDHPNNQESDGKCTKSIENLEEKGNDEKFFRKFMRRKSNLDSKKMCGEIEDNTSVIESIGKSIVDLKQPFCNLKVQQNENVSAYTEVNETLHLNDIYGFVNTIPDFELESQTSACNDAKITIPDTFLDLDSLQPVKDLDDLGSFKSIDVNLMDSLEDFPNVIGHSTKVEKDGNEKSTVSEIEVPELVPDEIVCCVSTENAIPLIHIEQSPEENGKGIAKDSIDAIVSDGPKEQSFDCGFVFKHPLKGKIKYSSSPLIEEEVCEEIVVEERRPATPDPQRVSSPLESPARIVRGPQSVTVLRGEAVTLAVSFDGHPTPTVTWMKGGRVLRDQKERGLSILEGSEMSVVTVNEVTADDSGKYVVSVENDGGGDSCFASVAVVGIPEPPGSEPTASEVTDHSLVVSWYGSMYDGGSVVTGYQVEMCTLPDTKWYKVASSVNTSCLVLGLSKGQKYVFRVRAENRYGVSHPSKESKVICLDDFLQEESSSDEETGEELSSPITVESGTSFTERFDLKEEVGKGRFGTVYRCVEVCCGRPRAAKVIRCLKAKDKEKVRQEIDIMSRLQHPKLMQVLAAFESGRNMIMVMEFISGGELFERVIADDFVLTEQDCILFMRQICNGVAYMHNNHVIHLDLKPENILCKTRSSHKIKIIDFGLARVYNADESLRVLFGTPEFVAPEVINYEPVCPGSDMWSVGVICYVLLSGLSPFMGDSDTETFANITRGEMDFDDEAFDEISQDAKDFISRLLVKQVKKRLSADECLKHPWLATSGAEQKRPLSTEKLKRFIIRRKWQKSGTAIRALGRMVSLSRSSLGSSCDSYSPLGSPTSSRSRSSLVSRSETAESGESDVFQER